MADIIKKEFMTKRSVMKSRFKTENYKKRWFVLSRYKLSYYDGGPDEEPNKLKGEILLRNIRVVEKIDPVHFDNKPNAFQVGYTDEAGEMYHLYVMALAPEFQEEWIRILRETSKKCGALFWLKYHPGIYNFKLGKWLCCETIQRQSEGCTRATSPQEKEQKANKNFPRMGTDLSTPSKGVPPERTILTVPNDATKQTTLKVLAICSYQKTAPEDLSLEKGEEYEVIDKKEKHWWKVKNSKGEIGYIPSNYIIVKQNEEELEEYDWYYPNTSRVQSEEILKQEAKEGCFLVRESSSSGMYTLSIYAKEGDSGVVKHYHIKRKGNGDYYLTEKHAHSTVPDLINYHKYNAAGMVARLRSSPGAEKRGTLVAPSLGHGNYEIDRNDLEMIKDLGAGVFGTVKLACYKKREKVAVKMMKEGAMSEDDFIEEAQTMSKLQHHNLVKLFGVSTKQKPLYIITEYMSKGSLLQYLKRHKQRVLNNTVKLIDFCLQVSHGMAYLEKNQFIHRDLAARNCLVGENDVCKVGDFGLARFVLDNEYTSSHGTKFPIRWASPEVLSFSRFSTKSDVWAYGVLMWEVFSGGSMPYGSCKNQEVVSQIREQNRHLECPEKCPDTAYAVMLKCWQKNAEDRPEFADIVKTVDYLLNECSDYV